MSENAVLEEWAVLLPLTCIEQNLLQTGMRWSCLTLLPTHSSCPLSHSLFLAILPELGN